MNCNRICFVIYGNDSFLCQETLHYILNLQIPCNYEIDYMIISDVHNIFEVFNMGIQESDAKYKVYINENVFIIDKSFLVKMVDIFTLNSDIGMLGALGYIYDRKQENLGIKRVGRLIAGGTEPIVYDFDNANVEKLIDVNYMDSNFIVTSNDEEWNIEDNLTKGMIEKSERFMQLGFRSVILKQEKPWCLYDNNLLSIRD